MPALLLRNTGVCHTQPATNVGEFGCATTKLPIVSPDGCSVEPSQAMKKGSASWSGAPATLSNSRLYRAVIGTSAAHRTGAVKLPLRAVIAGFNRPRRSFTCRV